MLLVSHAGPTAPELPLDELLELLDDVVPLEPEVPLVPLDPEVPLDPLVPEVPLEPLELDVAPVSAAVAESALLASAPSVVGVFVGSVVVLAPASGAGSAAFVSSTVLPSPSSGDVAQAEPSATIDRATETAMRDERLMAGTVAAELCTLRETLRNETLR